MINKILTMIYVCSLTHAAQTISTDPSQTAMDDFSSNSNSGGSGWSNNWSGGSFMNGMLRHQGNNPQQIKRQFTPGVDNSKEFVLSYDFALDVNASAQGNYGFRSFVESQGSGAFSMAWKNDLNGGNLTFYHSNNSQFILSDPDWNIASSLSTVNNEIFNLTVQFIPVSAQNPGQYNGTYVAEITRLSDGESYNTGSLSWVSSNLPSEQFNEIAFYNSSNGTVLEVDDLVVGNVPEPTTTLSLSLGLLALISKRSRRG